MAVYYETGVASTPLDLLEKLETFAEAHGWTADITVTASSRVLWNNSGGQVYMAVLAAATTWQTFGCLSVDTGVAWNAQPGISGWSHTVTWGAGPFVAYHFYVGDEDNNDYIHVIVEISAGVFRHWTAGQLVKRGSYTGGVYTDSIAISGTAARRNESNSSEHRYICDARCDTNRGGHIWVDYDSKVDNWQRVEEASSFTTTKCAGSFRTNGLIDALVSIGYTRWAERTMLWPLEYFANRQSSLRSPIGRIPHMRACNMTNLAPGDIITVGGETWQAFPPITSRPPACTATLI